MHKRELGIPESQLREVKKISIDGESFRYSIPYFEEDGRNASKEDQMLMNIEEYLNHPEQVQKIVALLKKRKNGKPSSRTPY